MFGRASLLVVMVVLVFVLVTSAFAGLPRPDLQVQSQADYLKLKEAISASQVVMTDLARSPNYRVVGVLASILQAAAKNPEITIEQLDAFTNSFDSHIPASYPTDENLLVPVNFMTAVRFGVRAAKQPGTRADFGLETLQMLGLHKEELSTQLTKLMSFINEQGLDLENSAEVNLVLTYGFLGLDANGESKAIVRAAFVHYLNSQGIDPFPTPAVVAEKYPDLPAAMAALPADYAALQDLRAQGFEPVYQTSVDQAFEVVDMMPQLIERAIQADDLQKSNYVASFVNPNIEFINAARAQRAEDIETLNNIRSQVYAQLAVVSVAGNDTQASKAATVAKYAGDAAQVAGGLSKIALAFYMPNPSTVSHGVGGVLDIFNVTAGMFGADQSSQQLQEVLGQVVQMRQQLLSMQEQLNKRLDAIDASLDRILYQLGDVQVSLSAIRASVLELQSDLSRMNQNLFGALADGYQQDFVQAIDGALAYKQNNNGWDLPYEAAGECFVSCESTIYTRATTEVLSSLLAGSTTGVSELTFQNAADANRLNQANYGYNINDLRLFPYDQGLLTGPLYPVRVANPTAWATAANAYAQLARENPWFYAMKDPSRLALITQNGQDVRAALQRFGNRQLLTQLVEEHRSRLAPLQTAVDAVLPGVLVNTTQFTPRDPSTTHKDLLDIYGSTSQVVPGWPTQLRLNAFREDGVTPLPLDTMLFEEQHLAKLSQSQLFLNQYLLNKGTLYVRARPYWTHTWYLPMGMSKMLYATPCAEVTIWHRDDRNTDTKLYGGIYAIGRGDILLDDEYYGTVTPDTYNQYLYLVYGQWIDGEYLRQKALNALRDGSMHLPDAARTTAVDEQMQSLFESLQAEYYTKVVSDLAGGANDVYTIGRELGGLRALIEAYVSLGYPQSMKANQLLRGLLKGDGFGLGKAGVSRIYSDAIDELPASPPDLVAPMNERLDALQTALDSVAPADSTQSFEVHPYLEYALAGLADIQPGRLQLANDDQYFSAGGPLVVPASAGVLANDAPEPVISPEHVGYDVVALFDQNSQLGGQRSTAQGGTVIFDADGSGGFSYQPPSGFTGTDSFQYVARGNYEGETLNPVFSNVATVYVRVVSGAEITAQPQSLTVPEGGTAMIKVGVRGECTIQWRRNGLPLEESNRLSGTAQDTLIIGPVQPEDAGSYDVVITPTAGAPFTSSAATLTVVATTPAGDKTAPDGGYVEAVNCVGTSSYPGQFYIEAQDRSAGILAVNNDAPDVKDQTVTVSGIIRTLPSGERYIEADKVIVTDPASVGPLFMPIRSLGGSDQHYEPISGSGQKGVKDGFGLNNVGLLVKTVGQVTCIDPGGQFFDIWDGSRGLATPTDPEGAEGVRVATPAMPVLSVGDHVVVTGVVSLYEWNSEPYPVLWTPYSEDILPLLRSTYP